MINEVLKYLYESFPQLIAAFLGTLGFAFVFKMKGRHLLFVSVSGFLTYGIYIIVFFMGMSAFYSALIAVSFASLLAEVFARISKAPTVIFLTVILIPIVPGSDLYYSMRYLLLSDFLNFSQTFRCACAISAGITCGITIVSVITKLLTTVEKVLKCSEFRKGNLG